MVLANIYMVLANYNQHIYIYMVLANPIHVRDTHVHKAHTPSTLSHLVLHQRNDGAYYNSEGSGACVWRELER
jgi:hypothetical protein